MLVIADIEANSLTPDKIWLIGVREVESGKTRIFRRPDLNPKEFLEYAQQVTGWVFHNGLRFDVPVLHRFFGPEVLDPRRVIDTLVVSRLLNFSREGGHSLKVLGEHLGIHKLDFHDFENFSEQMVEYLEGDLEVGLAVFKHFEAYIFSERWREALRTEHDMCWYCQKMGENGFYYDKTKSDELLKKITDELDSLDVEIQKAFPPKSKLVREITPSLTKNGTFHRKDFKWYDGADLTIFTPGAPFSLIRFDDFNAGSPVQIVARLNEAGWRPYEKTKTHIETERDLGRRNLPPEERKLLTEKLKRLRETGWKVSEANLATLPSEAPAAAQSLARRILLASRRGDIEEWMGAYNPDDSRVHGNCNSLGSWTHRASHTNPNTANIATGKSLYAHEMRDLWRAAPERRLIGVDADGIQLRIFAHYCEDDSLVESILRGDKADRTDIHSLNQRALGSVCKSRDDAKTYIYAFLLGAGDPKLATVLGCTLAEAKIARRNFLEFYPGLKALKQNRIPSDASRGYFEGFDGRYVMCSSEHHMLAGYLQNGESTIMKKATCIWWPKLEAMKLPFWLVNWVHDEWQTETTESLEVATEIGRIQADAIREAGDLYKLYCPLAGSYLKEDPNNKGQMIPSVGASWLDTH